MIAQRRRRKTRPMAERHVTFAEVEQILGLSSDAVRELMESKTLKGAIVDGVIQFRESDVKRLGGKSSGAGGERSEGEAGFLFLVDEEEEKRIEGKAYDGEALVKPRPVEAPGPDEEIIEPVGLSDEQLRNSAVLGSEDAVEFGRGVAERSGRAEFAGAEISEDEEILDASKVELPEPDFGKLASAFGEARREEPPTRLEEVEKPVEPSGVESETKRPGVELVRPTLELKMPVESAPVEEEVPASPREEVVESATAAGVPPEEPVGREVEPEAVGFNIDGEPEPTHPATSEKELTFLEEETGPMVCPVPPKAEEVRIEATEPAAAEPVPPVEPVAPVVAEAAPAVVEAAKVEEEPAAAAPVEEEAALESRRMFELAGPVEETAKEAATEEVPAETKPEEPGPEVSGREAVGEEPRETFELALPARSVPVTESFERAVDEEVEDREAEPEIIGVEAEPEKRVAADQRPPAPLTPGREPREEEEPVSADKEKKGEEMAKPPEEGRKPEEETAPENIEVFDLEAPGEAGGAGDEGLVSLEEEALKEEAPAAAPSKDKTLEEEMAELFGEEKGEQPAAAEVVPAAGGAPTEDFDLSVFKKEEGAEESAPVAEEALFEIDEQGTAPVESSAGQAATDAESATRIRGFVEQEQAPSNAVFTVAALLAFVVLAFTGMLLWHVFATK